jgi:hypothetical protein
MESETQTVRVADIHMPFGSMVGFMVKWAFATIPALFLIGAICFIILLALSTVGVGLNQLLVR